MAISTKVITMRQGNKADYQASKMLAGELAVINDTEELHFSPKSGKSICVATEKDLKAIGGKVVVDEVLSATSTNPVQNKVVTAKFNQLSEQKVDKANISLGTHTDGLIYIFVDGKPVGTGLNISGGTIEKTDNITLENNIMTILELVNEPTLTDGVLYIS